MKTWEKIWKTLAQEASEVSQPNKSNSELNPSTLSKVDQQLIRSSQENFRNFLTSKSIENATRIKCNPFTQTAIVTDDKGNPHIYSEHLRY